jgi:hypothetical protein
VYYDCFAPIRFWYQGVLSGHQSGNRAFVKANYQISWSVGQSVETQKLLHMGQKVNIHFPITPGSFEMRLQFLFLRISATSVWEMCSQYPSSTTFLANSRKFQRSYPSGGALQANAAIFARWFASISTGRPLWC